MKAVIFALIFLGTFNAIAEPIQPKFEVPGKFELNGDGKPVKLILDFSKSPYKFVTGDCEDCYDALYDRYTFTSKTRQWRGFRRGWSDTLEYRFERDFIEDRIDERLDQITYNMKDNRGKWIVGLDYSKYSPEYDVWGADVAISLDKSSLYLLKTRLPQIKGFACEILKVVTPGTGNAGGQTGPMCYGPAKVTDIDVWKTTQILPLTAAKKIGHNFEFTYDYETFTYYSNKTIEDKSRFNIQIPNQPTSLTSPLRSFQYSRVDRNTGNQVGDIEFEPVDEVRADRATQYFPLGASGSITTLGVFCSGSTLFARCEAK